jgi:hypothetical protein
MFRKRETGEGRMSATGGVEHRTSTEGRTSGTPNVPPSSTTPEGRTSATGGIESVPRRGGSPGSPSGVGGGMGSSGAGSSGMGSTGIGTGGQPQTQINDLDRRVDDLERRLANLSTARTTMASTGGYGQGMGERMGEVGEKVSSRVAEIQDVTGEKLRSAKYTAKEKLGEAQARVSEALQDVEIEEFRLRGNVAGHPFSVEVEDDAGERFLAFEVNLRTDQGDNIRVSGRKNVTGMIHGSTGTEGSYKPGRLGEQEPRYGSSREGGTGEFGRISSGRSEVPGSSERTGLGRGELSRESKPGEPSYRPGTGGP